MLWRGDGFWGREGQCSLSVSGRLTTLQWNAKYPRVYGKHSLDLIGLGVRTTQSWAGREEGMDLRGVGGREKHDQNMLCMKNSFSLKKNKDYYDQRGIT